MQHYETRRQMAGYLRDFKGAGDNFGALLCRLIQKSDPENRGRLRDGFPEMVSFYEEWEASKTPDEMMASAMQSTESEE